MLIRDARTHLRSLGADMIYKLKSSGVAVQCVPGNNAELHQLTQLIAIKLGLMEVLTRDLTPFKPL